MKYFAYGSNLDLVQMAQRCPAAKVIGPAQLANHRLCFPRRSPVRGCAVASVEAHKGEVVWGVIYELDDTDLERLDAREGFDPVNPSAVNRYCRVDVTVQCEPGGRVDAVAYIAVPEDDPGYPSRDYLKHIIDGAVAHSFPDDYIAVLRTIVAHEDAETEVVVSQQLVDEPAPVEPIADDDVSADGIFVEEADPDDPADFETTSPQASGQERE